MGSSPTHRGSPHWRVTVCRKLSSAPRATGSIMLEALFISNIVLWVMVIVLAAVVVALVRQVGVLHERVSPAGALVGREGPRLGEAAPEFELADWSGTALTLGGRHPDGKSTMLVFVSPTCPVCATLLP